MQHQDWTPVVLKKEKKPCHDGVRRKPVNEEDIGNVQKLKYISPEKAKEICQLRMKKRITREKLAQLVNEKPDVITRIEEKKEIHNGDATGKLLAKIIAKLKSLPDPPTQS